VSGMDRSIFIRATFSPGTVRSRPPAASSVVNISEIAVARPELRIALADSSINTLDDCAPLSNSLRTESGVGHDPACSRRGFNGFERDGDAWLALRELRVYITVQQW
jgi:hypothetical protein